MTDPILTVTGLVRDEGSIVLLRAEDEDREYVVAADHRVAHSILIALHRGEEPLIQPSGWQIIRTSPKEASHA